MDMDNLENLALLVERGKWPQGARRFWAFIPEGFIQGNLVSASELVERTSQEIRASESPGDAVTVISGYTEEARLFGESLTNDEKIGELNNLILTDIEIKAYGVTWVINWGTVQISSIGLWGFGGIQSIEHKQG